MKLYVGNLSWSLSEEELKTVFEECSTVLSVKIIKDRETNRSKGFGFVEIEGTEESVESLQGKEVQGRPINIQPAVEKPRKDRNDRDDRNDTDRKPHWVMS